MLTFKTYLVEAEFSEDDFTRVLRAFERRMPKLLGTSIYRNGGPDGSEHVAGCTGYLYYFKDRAFRVRAKGGHVQGIDVWTHFNINNGPDYIIDVHQLSASTLMGAMTKLAALIKHPTAGDVQISEEVRLAEMARRVDTNTFFDLARKKYSDDQLKKMTWAQIKTLADESDVLIPPYVRGQKVGRGLWSLIPGDGADEVRGVPGDEPGGEPPKEKKDSILYIKVTAQDPHTKKFISADGDKAAQRLYSQINGMLEKPTAAEVKDPETMYGHMKQLVDMACKGKLRSLLIYGGPGTGKTHTIMQTIKEQGLVAGKDYVKLSGKASPLSIYKMLFMYRDGGLVIFDDLDSMWGNQDATNILKGALDTSPVREISWGSSNTIPVTRMDPEEKAELFAKIDKDIIENPEKVKYPDQFDFTGRVIFISNLKRDQFDSAIMSRTAKIGMDMSPEQILQRMRTILPTLGGSDVPLDKKEELITHLLQMHKNREIDQVTMREFTKSLDIIRSGAPNWKELCIYA